MPASLGVGRAAARLAAVASGGALVLAAALAGPASASPAAPAGPAGRSRIIGCGAPRALSCRPARGTPTLAYGHGLPVQQIRQITRCGPRMYAVGVFTTLNPGGDTRRIVHRSNAFSFLARYPYTISSWRPDINGEVNSIAVGGPHCSVAYLGGNFTRVHRRRARDIAAVSATTGRLRARFRHDANKEVDTLLLAGRHLLAGGFFTKINGASHRYYVSLSPRTGANDGYLNLHITGHYRYRGVSANRTRVYNQQASPAGRRLLAEGDFTSVASRSREQIFMLSLGPRHARLTGWDSTQFDGRCQVREPDYIRAAAWSPSGSTVYIATTGFHPYRGPVGATRRTGLCDAAAAFPAADHRVRSRWVNYTGCDSLYSAAAGHDIVYVGGHERWADNGGNCNAPGARAIGAPGLAGLSASRGSVVFDPTRSRGLGADDMLLTGAGLWIASDTYAVRNSSETWCGSSYRTHDDGHAGLCLLPRRGARHAGERPGP